MKENVELMNEINKQRENNYDLKCQVQADVGKIRRVVINQQMQVFIFAFPLLLLYIYVFLNTNVYMASYEYVWCMVDTQVFMILFLNRIS